MYTKTWQVIKDDSKRTFECINQSTNTNAFTNEVYGMQRAGMNVSCTTPPITNRESSKELVKISGYTKEEGLYERLKAEYKKIIMSDHGDFDSGD